MKRKLSAIIASVIFALVAVVGCSGTDDKATTKIDETVAKQSTEAVDVPDKVATEAAEPAESEKPLGDDPITVTIMGNISAEENGIMKNPVADYIAENTGVTLDLTMLPDSGDSQNKLNAMIAANDLPDIFCLNGGDTQFQNLIKAQLIYPLDEMVEQHAPNMNKDKNALAMMAIARLDASDGKLYRIGMNKGYWDSAAMGPQRGYYIRWDLYKELGYPKVSTPIELAEVLAQMQPLEPETSGGQPTYAAAAWNNGIFDSLIWPQGMMEGFATGPGGVLCVDIATRQVLETSPLKETDSYLWNSLALANKLHQLGVFDPDSFTQTYQNYMDKSSLGQYMMSVLTWSAGSANTNFISAGTPEKQLICLPSKQFGWNKMDLYSNMMGGERQWCIATSCTVPERIVAMLDFMSTFEFSRIAHNGLPGVNWDFVDGKATPFDEYVNMDSDAMSENMLETGGRVFRLFTGYASATIDPSDGQAVDLLAEARQLTPAHEDFLAYYEHDTMKDVYMDGMESYTTSLMVNWGSLPDELKTYETNLGDYLNQGFVACIMAADDADFAGEQERLISGLDAYRVDEIFQTYFDNANANSDDAQAIYDILDS